MRAAVLHGPRDLRIETLPDPRPGPGEALLSVATAMSCGTDVKTFRGGHRTVKTYPSRLGHEFAGTIAAVGLGVSNVAVGDVVFCANSAACGACYQCRRDRESLCEDLLYLLGGFGEQVLVPDRVVRRGLYRLPEGLDVELAPLAEPLACAIRALWAVDLGPGDTVAIVGGGSLGLMLCALAAEVSARPIVVDPHEERLAQAKRFGAVETISASRTLEDVRRVRELTDGRGAEIVLEAVGRPAAWELAVQMAAPGGTVNLFGGCPRGTEFSMRTARVHYEEVTILGTYHHTSHFVAQALEELARGDRPWGDLRGPVIALEDLATALDGGLEDAPKFTVLPNRPVGPPARPADRQRA
jgi:L-iditol 2-dehydrogenase